MGHAIAFQGFNLIYALIIRSGLVEEDKIQQDKFVPFADRLKIIPNLLKHRIIRSFFRPTILFMEICRRRSFRPFTICSYPCRTFSICARLLEVWFYLGHRACHEISWLKPWHKQRHEFKAPVSLAAEYADWKEDIAIHLVSTTLGIMALGCHPLDFYFFMAFRIWETVDVHCGYALPFTPFRTEMHDYHHMRVNGCYGSFFMDDLMGTNKRFKDYLKKKKQQSNSHHNISSL